MSRCFLLSYILEKSPIELLMGEACSNGGYCMFDNWYVVQVRTGKEEEIVKKCQFYIDHGIYLIVYSNHEKKRK